MILLETSGYLKHFSSPYTRFEPNNVLEDMGSISWVFEIFFFQPKVGTSKKHPGCWGGRHNTDCYKPSANLSIQMWLPAPRTEYVDPGKVRVTGKILTTLPTECQLVWNYGCYHHIPNARNSMSSFVQVIEVWITKLLLGFNYRTWCIRWMTWWQELHQSNHLVVSLSQINAHNTSHSSLHNDFNAQNESNLCHFKIVNACWITQDGKNKYKGNA